MNKSNLLLILTALCLLLVLGYVALKEDRQQSLGRNAEGCSAISAPVGEGVGVI